MSQILQQIATILNTRYPLLFFFNYALSQFPIHTHSAKVNATNSVVTRSINNIPKIIQDVR